MSLWLGATHFSASVNVSIGCVHQSSWLLHRQRCLLLLQDGEGQELPADHVGCEGKETTVKGLCVWGGGAGGRTGVCVHVCMRMCAHGNIAFIGWCLSFEIAD